MALGSAQYLTEISTRDICWGSSRFVPRADNLASSMCRFSRNAENLNLLDFKAAVQASVKDCFAFCHNIRVPPYYKPWSFSCLLDIKL
jgi:hypothetical protein